MLVNLEPSAKVIEVKLRVLNAPSPMLVTLAGMVIEVKLDENMNAAFPMLINLDPASNITEVKLDAL